jgi:hypothetical protein
MSRVPFAFPAALLALAACHSKPAPAPSPTAREGAIAAAIVTTPAPDVPPVVAATPDPTPCGVGKLQRFLNLLPTETAKADIANPAGDRPIRYISVTENDSIGPDPQRLNVQTGADGRIKRFACG